MAGAILPCGRDRWATECRTGVRRRSRHDGRWDPANARDLRGLRSPSFACRRCRASAGSGWGSRDRWVCESEAEPSGMAGRRTVVLWKRSEAIGGRVAWRGGASGEAGARRSRRASRGDPWERSEANRHGFVETKWSHWRASGVPAAGGIGW